MPIRLPLLHAITGALVFAVYGPIASGEDRVGGAYTSTRPQLVMVARVTKQLYDELTLRDIDYDLTKRLSTEGVDIVGEAEADGKATIQLDTSGERPEFVVRLRGEAHTRLTLDAGPAAAYARSTTPFAAERRVALHGTRLIDGAVTVEAHGRTQLSSVCPRRGGLVGQIVKRVAWQKLCEAKPRINGEVDDFTEDFVTEKLEEVKDRFLHSVGRLAVVDDAVRQAFPDSESWEYQLWTDNEHIYVSMGPKQGVAPHLPEISQRSADTPLSLWVSLRPEQLLLAKVLLVANTPQQIIRQFMPEKIAAVLEGQVQISIVERWIEFKIPRPTVSQVLKVLPK